MEMMILLVLVLLTGLALAFVYYRHRPFGRRRRSRIVMIALRSALFLSLVIALLEPVLKFERLEQRKNVIPVLVDASGSMGLFRPDSSILPFLRSLRAAGKNDPAGGIKFVFYCFGDSLRPCVSLDSMHFSDRQSLLPGSIPDKQARLSPLCVIVSDGHFSNASLPRGLFQDMTCLYLPLPPASPRPFMSAELLSVNDHVELDSASAAVIRVHGFAGSEGDIQLTCKEKTGVVARKTLRIGRRGFFSDTAKLSLPSSRPGRFLYTVTTVSARDTIRRALYFPQTVVSGGFSARIISAAPSLDRRFITLALQNDPQWNIESSAAKECDALFAIDFSSSIADAFTALSRNGVAVFLGAAPCEGKTAVSPGAFPLVTFQPDDSIFRQFAGLDLPPPSQLFLCSKPFLSHLQPVLGCILPKAGSKGDTIPFISVGTYDRHDAIAVAGQNLWRTDFWPLSADGLRGSAPLLRALVSFVKQRIIRNSARNFLVYPATAEMYENDSLAFALVLPSDLADMSREETSAGGWKVRFMIDSLSHTVFATDDPGAALIDLLDYQRGRVVLPPLHSGSYRYRCSLEYRGQKREFSDSLFIDQNQEELSVPGQNSVVLDQFGLPLKENSAHAVVAAYAGASAAKRPTVTDALELRKTWALLSLIIVFLTLEWFLRKKYGLE